MEHVIMMHAKDNIAIVMAPSFAHKVAIKAIPKGGQIVKYGEPVGIATADIAPGEHVHVHNVISGRHTVKE